METNIISELITFIEHAPTAFHAVAELKEILKQEGFEELKESEKWKVKPGKRYYVTRNNSSIIAVKAGKEILGELGINGEYEGIGHCILGYPDSVPDVAVPRKEGRIYSF